MQKLTAAEIETINKDAETNWKGDLRAAVAATVFGSHIVRKFNSKVPSYAQPAQKQLISYLKGQITRANNKKTK